MTPALAHRWAVILTTAGLTTLFLTASQSAEMASQHGASAEASIGRTGKHDIGLKGHGFVRDSGGAVTTVDVPRAGLTFATRINNHGQIVGM